MMVQMWVEKLAVEWVKVSGSMWVIMLVGLMDQGWVKELDCVMESQWEWLWEHSWELLCVLEQMMVQMWVEMMELEWAKELFFELMWA